MYFFSLKVWGDRGSGNFLYNYKYSFNNLFSGYLCLVYFFIFCAVSFTFAFSSHSRLFCRNSTFSFHVVLRRNALHSIKINRVSREGNVSNFVWVRKNVGNKLVVLSPLQAVFVTHQKRAETVHTRNPTNKQGEEVVIQTGQISTEGVFLFQLGRTSEGQNGHQFDELNGEGTQKRKRNCPAFNLFCQRMSNFKG